MSRGRIDWVYLSAGVLFLVLGILVGVYEYFDPSYKIRYINVTVEGANATLYGNTLIVYDGSNVYTINLPCDTDDDIGYFLALALILVSLIPLRLAFEDEV